MSYMTKLEKHARQSVAMSVLNGMRHWLMGREESTFTDNQRAILRDALEFSEGASASGKMLFYSFRGIGRDKRPASVQLYRALERASNINQAEADRSMQSIKHALEVSENSRIDKESLDAALDLIEKAMHLISSESKGSSKNNKTKRLKRCHRAT